MTVRTRTRKKVDNVRDISIKDQLEKEKISLELEITENQLVRERTKKMHPRLNFALSCHVTHKNISLDFVHHKYLLPIYTDDAQVMEIGKPSQMGLSEYALVVMFEELDRGHSVFYVLPKGSLRDMFVKTRVNVTLSASPYYMSMMGKDKEGSVRVKKFKKADAAFVSAGKDSEMISYVADILMVDELNFCDKQQVKHARKRLGHSAVKIEKYFSTPTVKGVGIDDRLKATDYKHWMQRCTHCGERQVLDFFKNIVRDDEGEVIGMNANGTDIGVWCHKCGGEINRLGKGEYIALNKDKITPERSGIQVPAFASPNKSVKDIWSEYAESRFNPYHLQLWYNNDLGLSYTAEGAKLTNTILDACKGDYLMENISMKSSGIVTAGIDVGNFFHIRISKDVGNDERQAMYIGKIRVKGGGKQELIDLLKTYGVTCAVIDAAPERNLVDEIKSALPDIVWSCEYVKPDKTKESIVLHEEPKVVDVNRTWSLDGMVAQIKKANLHLPADAGVLMKEEYYNHMKASTRMLIKSDKGEEKYVWEEGSQEDHFFHAENYDHIASRIARELYGEPNIRMV